MNNIYTWIKHLIAASAYYSGLIPVVNWYLGRSGSRLIILNYHRATGNLREHVRYLQRHYRILPLEIALQQLYVAKKCARRRAERRPTLVLTFDDGYYDNYSHAYALARELRFPFTLFLVPGYIDSGVCFWWLESNDLAHNAHIDDAIIDGRLYHLGSQASREALARTIDAHARHAGSVEEREDFLTCTRAALATAVATRSSVSPEDRLAYPLTWAEVREMEASGWVTYGAHTMHHPTLAYLNDQDEVVQEVEKCRIVLEQQLGHSVRSFAYPNGKPNDIGVRVRTVVQQAGYRWAVTTVPGINTPQTDPLLLRRISTDASEHWLVVAAQAAGLWTFLSHIWYPVRLAHGVGEHLSRRLTSRGAPRQSGNRLPPRRCGTNWLRTHLREGA